MVVLFVVLFSVVFVVFLFKCFFVSTSSCCEKEERKEFALTEKTILAGKKRKMGGNT